MRRVGHREPQNSLLDLVYTAHQLQSTLPGCACTNWAQALCSRHQHLSVHLVRRLAEQHEDRLLHRRVRPRQMPPHLPDGDLRRRFLRVAVHPRADRRKADGAHRALIGHFHALAVAPRQQLRFPVAAIAIHWPHRVEYVLRRQVAGARRHRAAGGASARLGAGRVEFPPDRSAPRAGGGARWGARVIAAPPAGGMPPPTPPPPASAEFAALAIASTAIRVMSPSCKTIFLPVAFVQSIRSTTIIIMTRRELLAAGAAFATCATPLMAAKTHIDKSRISAITDEIGLSTLESVAFAHFYGMQNVEIRNPPGKKEYFLLPEPEIKADADLFAKEGLKVSFVNTSLLKFTWPGTEPVRRRTETPEARDKRLAAEKVRWDQRMQDLQKGIHCAQIMGCDKVRVFAGARVADPTTVYQRIPF